MVEVHDWRVLRDGKVLGTIVRVRIDVQTGHGTVVNGAVRPGPRVALILALVGRVVEVP